jgi:hypothetical protein
VVDTADSGAARAAGYSPAEAAHMFEEFLEYRLGHDVFWEWLMRFPSGNRPRDPAVEDEIDRAILALQAFHEGHRSWNETHRELMDCRSRLTGLARF